MKSLLSSEHIKALIDEESVRGVLVKAVFEEAESASDDELVLLEKSLQLLLARFQSMEGEGS